MKYVLEFGVKGGQCVENIVLPTHKLAMQLATSLRRVLGNSPLLACETKFWQVRVGYPRAGWESPTHYVAISILDGVARGPASSKLWKK